MAEVSIGAALEKLEGSTVAVRNDGLEDVKHIFGHARGTAKLDSLGDAGFQRIFESLFSIIRTEKSKHIKATTPTAKNSAESKLSQSSAALRVVADAAATRIKHKTAVAVLNHVVDTLPVNSGGLFTPIRNDYMKSFRGLLQNPSLREHLKAQEWEGLIDFIVEALNFRTAEEDSQSNGVNSRDASVDTRGESRMSMRISQVSRGRTSRTETSSYVEELVISLKLLTVTSNPGLTSKSSSIIDCCLSYLGAATKSQEPAVEALNNVFLSVLANDTALARSAANEFIPILRRMWSTRIGSLKDQLLIFLLNAKDLFRSSNAGEPLLLEASILHDLLETISSDYERRQERDCLQMDDIYFPDIADSSPLRTLTLAPVRDSMRALTNWSCVTVLATLVSTLNERHFNATAHEDADAAPSKRRKIEGLLEGLVHQAISSSSQERLCAIQTLIFAMEESEATRSYLAEHLLGLAIGLSSDEDTIANWSMLLISRFVFTIYSKKSSLQEFWSQSCSLVARSVSSQGLSRAACHFLDSVLRAGVLDEISQPELVLSAMFANGSQGPSVLTDSALSLWHSILASGESGSMESLQSVSLRAITWLNTHWTIPPVLDRLHNASLARHSREASMYKLLMACMNISTGLKHKDFSIITSPIYIRRSHIMDSLPATRYLLHQSKSDNVSCGALPLSSPVTADVSSRGRIQHAVCELLLMKLKNFRDTWNKLQQERSSNVSTDIIQILSSACTVASGVSAAIDDSTTALCKDVVVLIGNIWTDICGILSALRGDLRQRCLTMAASSLLSVDPEDEKERISLVKRRHVLTVPILELLRQCLAQDLSQNEIEDDMMGGQDSFAVQNSQTSSDLDTSQIPRQKVPFVADMHTLLVHLTCCMLISELEGQFSEGDDPRVAAAVIDFAAELKPADVVAAREALTEFFDSSPTVARTDATRLLQALAETCLQEVDFERCEAALCLCVDVLASLAKLWTIDNGDDLASMACDIYEWYLDTAVGKGIATEKVMLAIARMLTAVSASDTTFGSGMSLPSPRTSLLRLLKAGNHVVQFNLADLICQIFEGFVLSEHWAIFDDVVAGLPADAERVEGIAVRLYILGKLGSRWHTLLRKAVYSVFETAAKVTTALPFAQKCFKAISDSLGLLEPRELFILFSPQILYTWLEKESLDSIPFQAFEYKDLLSLFHDVQNEAVSQIAMRSRTSHATAVAQLTGQAWSQMLCGGFVEAEAYCIARDIGTPRDEQSKASEALLRKQLGNDIYLEQIQEKFPQILARLFMIISDDHGMEKALSKRKSLVASQVALTEICKRSQSTTVLPKGQQPSYRAKYILDEIDYLCKRIDRDFTTIWEPSLVVYVCRILFDSAIPPLGPLHACAVIRKVRIVVCLAQRQALKGYALEMLLHTLRPFLTDFHCSEDALGLFWYLLDHGKSYLESHVSFFASLVVSTFATISMFLRSSQDSTTQESHFKSTMSKVQAFREWVVKYVQGFQAVNISAERSRTFGTIMLLASGINAQGGSTKGNPKGDLIYLLLQDQRTSERLLSRTAFVQVMELLCHNFIGTVDPQDDILYSSEDAVEVGPILWGLLSKITNSPFTMWVAQVIGRAYACSGYVDGAESNEQHNKSSGLMIDKIQGHSYISIVDSLATMLRKDDRRMSGVAERALQLIFTAFTTQEKSSHFSSVVETSLLDGLTWTDFPCPKSIPSLETTKRMHATLNAPQEQSAQTWACNVAVALCGKSQSDPLLLALPVVLSAVPALAADMLPSIVHIVLLAESNGQQPARQALSMVINETLADWKDASKPDHIKLVLNVLLYLRHQPLPTESTMADRNMWLDVSLTDAAEAASACGMQSAALLFLELAVSQQTLASARSSRKSTVLQLEQYDDLLQQIFSSVNDPDFFFGMQEKASLQSVLSKLAHEDSAYKNLSFQSALFDTECRISNNGLQLQDSDIVAALSRNNLNGIARAVQLQTSTRSGKDTNGGVFQIAMNLHQWDLPFQAQEQSSTTIVLGTLRAFENFSSTITLAGQLDSALKDLLNPIAQEKLSTKSIQSNLGAMAILTELRELLSTPGIDNLQNEMGNQTTRARWEAQESFDLVSPILVGREAAMTAIKSSASLRTHFRINLSEAQLLEIDAVRNSVKVARSYNAAQFCLNRVMYLSKLMEMPTFSSHKVEAAILHDTAHVLWDQGETSASIQMLRQLQDRKDLGQQAVSVSRAEILADLGNQIAEARLNKPDEIIAQYLIPAIEELRGKSEGAEAGRVFHNFAVFCDMQLQNTEDKEEFARVESLRQSKNDDIDGWTELVRAASADPKKRDTLKKHLGQAKQWFKLDDEEYQRLKRVRERFIAQSLENYLRSMAASDMYVNDTLRFVALWLDQSDSENAQAAVGKYLATVPSSKFAPLANQLFSRILDSTDPFQQLLTGLLYRVCCDHPHHSLYQLFAASKSKAAKNDLVANSRYGAAGKLAEKIMKQSHPGLLWVALHNCSIAFVRLANEKVTDQKIKSGSKILLRNIEYGRKLEQTVHDSSTKIPPPTMKIVLRTDCDYSSTPNILKFTPEISIAGGVSCPKIMTIIATDGTRHKMLVKGGNDDLRQDSIMEQVFEQVSNLLKDHRKTRQRNLGIRTYKVLPLTPNAGIIEFVKDTIPLHEYLLPAHLKYYPKDFKASRCRKEISDAQGKPLAQRIQAYRTVCANFRPAMRFFFMERFLEPDDWFQRRLAFSRSVAATSILGYVLGLGDRHGHNILLDEKTGEVVHIDLGVAFEAGRILPVPEVVPFRLTRDMVDGMGLSGVEGVFRRCCNFTLEALREDQYSIMTVLDVLRYDPLYSWSMTPLRLQKMQEAQDAGREVDRVEDSRRSSTKGGGVTTPPEPKTKKIANEASEADRALTVVAKKLGKGLSVEATVNELIQQATDEKNLATLYCGWAAYA